MHNPCSQTCFFFFLQFNSSAFALATRGVQAVITGGYWLKPLTANRLAVILFLPTATANRLGGGGYFYNRRLAVITGGLKPLLNSDFGPGLNRF